jgi:hypothetical protein
MSNKMKLEVERVSNGWIAKSDIGKTYYTDVGSIIKNANLVTDEELISEGQYIIDIEITPVKSIGEQNTDLRATLVARDKQVYDPIPKKWEGLDFESDAISVTAENAYASERLKSINFTKYFSQSILKDREFAEMAGLKTQTFASLKRNTRLGTTTFSHISVRISMTIIAKYFERVSKKTNEKSEV